MTSCLGEAVKYFKEKGAQLKQTCPFCQLSNLDGPYRGVPHYDLFSVFQIKIVLNNKKVFKTVLKHPRLISRVAKVENWWF